MATFDLTASGTTGVGANSIAVLPSHKHTHVMRNLEACVDVDDWFASGNTLADVYSFRAREIPA